MIRPVLGGCWGEARVSRACGFRAISNGMVTPTLFSWRPVVVRSRTPVVVFPSCVRNRLETCKAVQRSFGSEALCADVACLDVGMADERPGRIGSGRSNGDPLLSETLSAKEAKEADRLWWKTPRLFQRGKKGIAVRTKWQSGSADGQRRALALKGEPPPSATRGVLWGNPTRT